MGNVPPTALVPSSGFLTERRGSVQVIVTLHCMVQVMTKTDYEIIILIVK